MKMAGIIIKGNLIAVNKIKDKVQIFPIIMAELILVIKAEIIMVAGWTIIVEEEVVIHILIKGQKW